MKDLLTSLTERLGQKLNNYTNKLNDEINEGMSINDFNKMMNKFKKMGVNLNNMPASQLMYTLYKTLDKNEFHALGMQIDQAKDELKKQPVSCGGGSSCGGGYSCGYDDDRC